MNNLELKITSVTPEAIPGERLIVKFELTNRGNGPLSLPARDGLGAFGYTVRSDSGDELFFSRDEARHLRNPNDNFPPLPLPTTDVAPGATVHYEEDLSYLAIPPLAPGHYAVSVSLKTVQPPIQSSPWPTKIVASAAVAAADAVDSGRRAFAQLLIHGEASGAGVLSRDANEDAPGDGRWYRHALLPTGLVPRSAAIAQRNPARQPARWSAWISGETLGAVLAAQATVLEQVPHFPVGLRSAVLSPVGWQPKPTEATFAVLGIDKEGKVALAAVTVRSPNAHEIKAARLELSSIPRLWAARYDAASAQFTVVAAEPNGTGVRIVKQTCLPAKGTAEKRVVLYESAEPIVTLALDPVPGTDAVDVLLGPSGHPDPKMTLLRLPLGGGGPTTTWHFGLPPPDAGAPKMWAMTSPSSGAPVVLASDGRRIDVLQPGSGAAWVKIEDTLGVATQLTAITFANGGAWASWLDARGVRLVRVR